MNSNTSNSVNRHQTTCARTDRDMFRVCPSKLSRRELENLYFTLLENNVDLKKNLNMQQEKIKTLSTKVQRLTNTRNVNAAGKDSPVTTAIVSEQRDSIVQLKRVNERMAERIRVLNMKLCTAKQFLGKNKVNNLNNATLSSSCTKTNSTSCSNPTCSAGPSQIKTNSVGTETDYFAEKYSNSSCEIKCRTTMDELKEKIDNLQEELLTSRQRIEKLEALLTRLQGENLAVRAERAASEDALQEQDAQLEDLREKLRCAEAKVNDMNIELTIEKKKLAELETELKLAENIGNVMSSSVAKTIEELEQKKVGDEINSNTDEGILIRDEITVARDEVNRVPDNVQFIRGEAINVGRNEVNRVPDDVEYNWGEVMAGTAMDTAPNYVEYNWGVVMAETAMDTAPDDNKLARGERKLTIIEVDKVPEDIKLTQGEENVTDDKIPGDNKLTSGEENEAINVGRNEVNRIPDDIEYNWGDFISRSDVNIVPDDKKITRNEVNVAKNYVKGVPEDNEIIRDKVNVERNDVNGAPNDVQFIRGELINKERNEVNRVPDEVEYNWGELMTSREVVVPRYEVKKAKDEHEMKSLCDDMKEHPGYIKQENLNKSIETERSHPDKNFNQELINKISELVSQLEMLKKTAAGEAYTVKDDIVKEKPTEYKSYDGKTKKPGGVSSPINNQKPTQKSYDDKTKETDNILSQPKKQKLTHYTWCEVKSKGPDRFSSPKYNQETTESYADKTKKTKENLPQYKLYDGKIEKTKEKTTKSVSQNVKTKEDMSNLINKENPTQYETYSDKTRESDIISSEIKREKQKQYESCDINTEETGYISIQIDTDKSIKYKSYDVETAEVDDILIQKTKDNPIYESSYVGSRAEEDIESQMKKKLAEYESIDVTTTEADNILSKISDTNLAKYESSSKYFKDFESKESYDPSTRNDTIECIMGVKSNLERNKFIMQEPVSTNETKGISQDTEQKQIDYPIDDFGSSHEQSIKKLRAVGTTGQEIMNNTVSKSSRNDDDTFYQIPGPISGNFDQKKVVAGDPYLRKSVDDITEKTTDSYKKGPAKISYVEKGKQVGSIGESPLKTIIDEKSAKRKDSYGESLRKRSLEEKSEKIRKTFSEPPNRTSFQQTSENIKKTFHELTGRQSFDEQVIKISDNDDTERSVIKSKDPLSTRPSIGISEKAIRMSLAEPAASRETLFDEQRRLSLSPKTASIIKDYARDLETKTRKVRPRFSIPCATVMGPTEENRFLQSRSCTPMQSIIKTKDVTAATSSPYIKEPGVTTPDNSSTTFNMDVGGQAPSTIGGQAPTTVGGQENAGIEPATVARMKDIEEPFEICAANAIVCVCPASEVRGASAFRTCTGNICFRTKRPHNIRHCACHQKAIEHYNCGMGAGPSSHQDSCTSMGNMAPRTYSVADKHSRATSPDNTDHEISSMTDWPSEKDGQKPARNSPDARARIDSLSEEKLTTSGTEPPSDNFTTASEGEVPAGLTSVGEKEPGVGSNHKRPYTQQNLNKTESMEATLQSISDELARCRKLLLSQRNQEKDYPVEHALRRSPATRQLSATYTPVCIFTLHIGTLVLSDDAVVWSRDKNLVLTWKFYSQSAAMTRVQPGRVAIFDFVTEYDVVFNDDMLNYMKNSEMPIVLCELGKEEKPFAKCWLPLQEALLHANRRADMSLALVPCYAEDPDNRRSFGEEMGVLDIWCSLRLDKSLLSVINRAMHKPSYNGPEWHIDSRAARESRIIQQAAEDEPSRDSSQSRQSRDFTLGRLSQQKRALLSMTVEAPRWSSNDYPTGCGRRNFYVPGQDIPCHASERYAEETQENHQQRPRYGFHSFSSPVQKTQLDIGNRGQDDNDGRRTPDYQASGIIINEVPANIRTDNDLREALEQKVRQDDMARWPKMEDYDSSLKHSSFGSVRSLAARHQLAKLKTPQKHRSDYIATDSLQDILNKEKQYIPNNIEGSDPNFARSAYAYKHIGVPGINKLAEASRKNVKYSNAIEHDLPKVIEITILWLALNEECEAMANPNIKRLYVAYSFLGRTGADLETPFSLPKPKHYADKCYFNFKKTFHLHEADLPLLGHMAQRRSGGDASSDPRDCVVFTLVSEPPEDPLGLASCEDVGYAYLYLGDVLAYSGGSNGYTEVIGVHGVRGGVCGVLAVRVDNLAVLRLCLTLTS